MDTFKCGRARRETAAWAYRDSYGYLRCRHCTRTSNNRAMNRARTRRLAELAVA